MTDTTYITIDRHVTGFDLTTPCSSIHADGWTVAVQHLFADDVRCEHFATAEQRDEAVCRLTAEYEAAGRTVVVVQPRTPAAYHVDEMALRDYAPAPTC